MADLADMIQKLSFYQAGGKDPGTGTLDKINSGFGIIDKTITDVLAIKKAKYEASKAKAETGKLGAEKNKLDIGNKPQSAYMSPVQIPTQGPADEQGAGPAPVMGQKLDTSLMTPDTQETFASADLKRAQADYLRSGQKGGKKSYINLKTLDVSEVPLPGYVETTQSSAVSAGSFPARNAPLERERNLRRGERYGKYGSDLISKFNSDPNVRKYKQSIDEANMIRELAVSDNPIGAAAIPTFSARMSREVGNLSEADKAPFGGTRAILGRVEAALQEMSNGTLTDDNKAFIIELTEIISKNSIESLDREALLRSKQNATTGLYGSQENIHDTLNPPPSNAQSGTTKSGMSYEVIP